MLEFTEASHRDKARVHKLNAVDEAKEAAEAGFEAAKDMGGYIKEKVLEGAEIAQARLQQQAAVGKSIAQDNMVKLTSHLGEKAESATEALKENVVVATEFMKTKADEAKDEAYEAAQRAATAAGEYAYMAKDGAYDAAQRAASAAGEYAYMAKETAKEGAKVAADEAQNQWHAATTKAGNLVRDAQEGAFENGFSSDDVDEKEIARLLAQKASSKAKDGYYKVKDTVDSYTDWKYTDYDSSNGKWNNIARAWSRMKAKLYSTQEQPSLDGLHESIAQFIESMNRSKKTARDPRQITEDIIAALYGTETNAVEGAKEKLDQLKNKAYHVKDQAENTKDKASNYLNAAGKSAKHYAQDALDRGSNTIKDFTKSSNNALMHAFERALRSKPSSGREFWNSVHNVLEDNKSPLTSSVSSFSFTPIPTTSLYSSLFTLFLVFYSLKFKRSDYEAVPQTVTSNSQKVAAPVSGNYASVYSIVLEKFGWVFIVLLNLLVLEFNGYSSFTLHGFSLLTGTLETASQIVESENIQRNAKAGLLAIVLISSVLNLFTALTGFPLL